MKFTPSKNIKQMCGETPELTVEDVMQSTKLQMREQAAMFGLLACNDPIDSFIQLASKVSEDHKQAIANLTASEKLELADVFNTDVAGLESLSASKLLDLCEANLPNGCGVANEGLVEDLLILFLGNKTSPSMQKVASSGGDHFGNLYKDLVKGFPADKIKDALNSFTVDSYKYQDYKKLIDNLAKAWDTIKSKAGNLFSEQVTLVELEKIAAAMWAPAGSYDKKDAYGFWNTWNESKPVMQEAKTLTELGFDAGKLGEISSKVATFVAEYMSTAEVIAKKSASIQKKSFFEIFKSKAKKEAIAQERAVAKEKYDACKRIFSAIFSLANEMSTNILYIANKMERLAKKG